MAVEHVTQRELATRLGLETRQIRRLGELGIPCRIRGGKKDYPWALALKWYLDYKIEAEVRQRLPGDKGELEMRELAAKVRLAELKVAEAEGKVIPVQVVQRQLEFAHQQTASAIRSLPQHAGEVVALATLADARLRLEAIADSLLERARGDDDDEPTAKAA